MSVLGAEFSASTIDNGDPFVPVDCSANPWDLRPAVQAIMKATNWILERIPKDQKLVILIGELHFPQTHKFIQQMLLNALAVQKENDPTLGFAFGYEAPHTYRLDDAICSPPDHIQDNSRHDRYARTDEFDVQAKSVFKLCMAHNISLQFNDIADLGEITPGRIDIDQSDPFTAKIVEYYRPDLVGKNIPRWLAGQTYADHDGHMLSDLAMTENIIAHMEQTGARLYVQQCGQSHPLGQRPPPSYNLRKDENPDGYRYEHSFTVQLQKRGFFVLPVLLEFNPDCHIFPVEAAAMIEKSIKIRGLSPVDTGQIPYEKAAEILKKHSDFQPL